MKWNELSYTNRLKVLPLIIILAGVLVYSLTLSKTIALSQEVDRLQNELNQVSMAPVQIQKLKQELADLNSKIGNHSGDISQEGIFRSLSQYCTSHNLMIREFPVFHKYANKDHEVRSFQLEIEGGFHNLLKLVYHLEQKIYLGKIASLHFEKKRNRRSRREYLSLKITLQTVL